MTGVVTIVQIMLGFAAALALVRAVRGPNLVDRIVVKQKAVYLVPALRIDQIRHASFAQGRLAEIVTIWIEAGN